MDCNQADPPHEQTTRPPPQLEESSSDPPPQTSDRKSHSDRTHTTPTKKGCSPAEKYGRYRWIEILQRGILDRIDKMEKRQRLILKGLQHYFVFPEDYVLNVIAETRLDHAILQVLREAGPGGALPSKIAYQLRTYGVDRFKVTRCIKAMNRRLQRELGYDAVEKVGHRWVLTDFMDDIWGCEKEEMEHKTSQ